MVQYNTTTIAVECPDGTVRVIFVDDGYVNVLAGKIGQIGATTADAIGRLVTYAVLQGGALKDIADLLRGISYEDTNNLVYPSMSIPDAVAVAIDRYLELQEETDGAR